MAEKKNPKLHELLAVKKDLQQQAAKTRADLENTFEKKQHHFTGKLKTFTPNGEDAVEKTEDKLEIQTTVNKELGWLKPYLAKSLDAHYHVAAGNMKASSNVVLEDGTVLLVSVPASTLLELEDYLEGLRGFIMKIPTLDPSKGYHPDSSQGDGVYQARAVEKIRTMAQKKVYVLYPATEKHPAQVQLVDEQVPVGTIREQEWSSMLTPTDKGHLLDRCEVLLRAVKKARARANEAEVDVSAKIGDSLIGYVFGV